MDVQTQQRFEHWINHPHLEQEIGNELRQIAADPQQIEERFFSYLTFGTGGMRGIIGAGTNRMNRYTIRKATLGLAHYLHNQSEAHLNVQTEGSSVVIAYDCRHYSPQFAEEAALTLAAQGIKAYIFPSLRSTPQLSFSVRHLQAQAGIMITASHNPPEYNGYKVYGSDGAQLNLEQADQVIKHVNAVQDELAIRVLDKEQAQQKGLYEVIGEEVDEAYHHYVASLVLQPDLIKDMADSFRIVFTPLHGAALHPVQEVLQRAGFKQVHTVEQQAHPDPDFSTVGTPNPEEPAAFEMAMAEAYELGADMIVGTDPDADRMGIVVQDHEGAYQVLTGNQTGALLLHYILSQKQERGELSAKHTMCKTIVTSELGRKVASSFGVDTVDTLTGFKFIGEEIKSYKETGQRDFVFGYEESYGYLIGDEVRDKDAIQAVLLAAEMGTYYKAKNMTVYEALQSLYETYGYYQEDLISVKLEGKEGMEQIQGVLSALRQQPPLSFADVPIQLIEDYSAQTRTVVATGQTERIMLPASNVIKYILEDGTWVCVRPSGTEPKLKLYIGVVENTAEEAGQKMKQMRHELEQMYRSLMS